MEWLKNYNGRLIVFHGDNDRVILHKFSQKLYESVPAANKEYILLPGAGHNDIWSSPVFQEKIIRCIGYPEGRI